MKLEEFIYFLDSDYEIWLIDKNGEIFESTSDSGLLVEKYGCYEIYEIKIVAVVNKVIVKVALEDYTAEVKE